MVKTSVIIPAYNCAELLREALDSCLIQTYPLVEIIVVDDGSTDDTRIIVESKYRDAVKYIYQENSGLSAARNRGIDKSTGNYLVFLDADDVLLPQKIAIQVELLERHSDVDVVYSASRYFPDGNDDHHFNFVTPGYSGDILEVLVKGNFIPVNAAMVRREAAVEEMFDEEFRSLEDWDFWLRLSLKGSRFLFHDEVLSLVRVRRDNMSKDRDAMYHSMVNVIDKFIGMCRRSRHKKSIVASAYLTKGVYGMLGHMSWRAVNRCAISAFTQCPHVWASALKQTIKNTLRYVPLFARAITRPAAFDEIQEYWQSEG